MIFIFQNFHFFIKKVTEGLFDYYGIVSKEKIKKDLVHNKLEGIIFYIKFFVKLNFQKTKILPNLQRTSQREARQQRIEYIEQTIKCKYSKVKLTRDFPLW